MEPSEAIAGVSLPLAVCFMQPAAKEVNHHGSRRCPERIYLKRAPEQFAHLLASEVQFPQVAPRTATSIVLLIVLVSGIFTPSAFCVLMCERHTRVATPTHCVESADAMPGMVHDHSAMNPPAVETVSLVAVSQSCQTDCVTAVRLDASRKVVPQVTVVQSISVVPDATADSLVPDFSAAWGLNSGPPALPHARAASFSILRI